MQVLESSIEQSFVAKLKKVGLVSIKLNLQGTRGWPDRLVLVPGGVPLFIEFKRPGEDLRALQRVRHDYLRSLEYDVETFDDAEEAFQHVLDTAAISE